MTREEFDDGWILGDKSGNWEWKPDSEVPDWTPEYAIKVDRLRELNWNKQLEEKSWFNKNKWEEFWSKMPRKIPIYDSNTYSGHILNW